MQVDRRRSWTYGRALMLLTLRTCLSEHRQGNNLFTVIPRNHPISVAFYDAHWDTEDLFVYSNHQVPMEDYRIELAYRYMQGHIVFTYLHSSRHTLIHNSVTNRPFEYIGPSAFAITFIWHELRSCAISKGVRLFF